MNKPKIAVIGLSGESVFMSVDRFHQNNENISCYDFHREPGGKGYNQAIAAQRFGGECYFLSSVGNDDYANHCEDYLKNEGINSYLIRKSFEKTAYATILTDKNGENQVSVFKGASDKLTIEDVKNFENIIKICDVMLIQNEIPINLTKLAISIAKKYHVLVIFNPAPAKNIEELDLELLKSVTVLTPNEIEARTIFNIDTNQGIDDIIHKIIRSELKKVVITLGKRGCLVIDNNDVTIIPSLKVKSIDSTGAGDVFNAALAIKLVEKNSLVKSATYANVAAGLSVTKKHVLDSIPNLDDIENYISKNPHL